MEDENRSKEKRKDISQIVKIERKQNEKSKREGFVNT